MKLHLAGCVIEDIAGKILLLHRNSLTRQQWETPGGKVENGEHEMDAARREVREELGVEVEITGEIGRHDFLEDGRKMGYVWFAAKILSGEPAPLEQKHDRISYFSWEEIAKMRDISPNTKNLVQFHFTNKNTKTSF